MGQYNQALMHAFAKEAAPRISEFMQPQNLANLAWSVQMWEADCFPVKQMLRVVERRFWDATPVCRPCIASIHTDHSFVFQNCDGPCCMTYVRRVALTDGCSFLIQGIRQAGALRSGAHELCGQANASSDEGADWPTDDQGVGPSSVAFRVVTSSCINTPPTHAHAPPNTHRQAFPATRHNSTRHTACTCLSTRMHPSMVITVMCTHARRIWRCNTSPTSSGGTALRPLLLSNA